MEACPSMTHPLPVALVLGLSDTGLAAARSLGRRRIPVLGLDVRPDRTGFASRYLKAMTCPDPQTEPEALRELLLSEARRLDQPGILFPSTPAFVRFVSREREGLRGSFLFNLADADLIEAMLDREEAFDLARRIGTRLPATHAPRSLAEVEAIAPTLTYPVILRPASDLTETPNERWTTLASSPRELLERYAELAHGDARWLIQAYVPGPPDNLLQLWVYLDVQGEVLGMFGSRTIRQHPAPLGEGCLIESVRDAALIAEGLHVLRGLGYRGLGCVEFKRDPADDRLKLIGMTPCLRRQSRLSTDCGVDLPLMLYRDLLGDPMAARYHFSESQRWLDADANLAAVLTSGLKPEVWLQDWLAARSFARFAWDDPGPFLQSSQWGVAYLRRLWRRMPKPRPPAIPPGATQLSDA